MKHPKEVVLALIITAFIFWAAPARACPPVQPVHGGWLYPECRVRVLKGRFAKAEELMEGCRETLSVVRYERDQCLDEALALAEKPSAKLWPWFVGGAGVVAVPVGVCALAECSWEGWAIGGGLVVVGGLLAAILE